ADATATGAAINSGSSSCPATGGAISSGSGTTTTGAAISSGEPGAFATGGSTSATGAAAATAICCAGFCANRINPMAPRAIAGTITSALKATPSPTPTKIQRRLATGWDRGDAKCFAVVVMTGTLNKGSWMCCREFWGYPLTV